MKKKTALLSVSEKQGIVEFARTLVAHGWELIASGGTAKTLTQAGVPVKDVAELVGGGPILGHRVVTLSREVHAGLLATESPEDLLELESLGIPFINLACVDFYALENEISRPSASRQSVIEKTDIGGPTMVRSAAKGRRLVIADPADRKAVLDWIEAGEPEDQKEQLVDWLCAKAEYVVAKYVLASAIYHGRGQYEGFIGTRVRELKYGENAWQTPAALYSTRTQDPLALEAFQLVQGQPPSYNTCCDLERLLQTITHIAAGFATNTRGGVPFIAVGAKHGNPCGASYGGDRKEVIQKMVVGDRRAIFGGLVILNFPLDEDLAETLLTYELKEGEKRRLLDGVAAPSITPGAVEMLRRKGDKCRIMVNPALEDIGKESLDAALRFRYVRGGFLTQPNYTYIFTLDSPNLKKFGEVPPEIEGDVLLAWGVGATSNSNTIDVVKDRMLIGNGTGQQDRVGAARLACSRADYARHDTSGGVAYSDSFFPFADGPKILADHGIAAILTSSGSVRDADTEALCKQREVTLWMVPDAEGRGFFGH